MHFIISAAGFKRVLALVSDVVPARSVTAEGSGLLLECNKENLVLTAVGSDIIVRTSILVESFETGRVCLNAHVLANLVNSYEPFSDVRKTGTDKVEVKLDSKSNAVLFKSKTGYQGGRVINNLRKLPMLNADLFPSFPRFNSDLANIFPSYQFRESVQRTCFTSSADATGVISGVSVSCKNKQYTVVTTDRVCLSEYVSAVDSGIEFDVVVPKKFILKASKVVDPTEPMKMLVTDNIFWVSSPGVLVGGVIMSGEYPDYKSFLSDPPNTIIVDKGVFFSNLKSLDFSSVDDDRVDFSIRSGKLLLKTELAENSYIDCSGFDGDFDVSFNIKQMRSALNCIEGMTLAIGFSDKSKPVYVTSPDYTEGSDMNNRVVIMPLNV